MTAKQLQLLSFIRNNIVHAGKAPTFSSMRTFMNVSSNQAIEDILSILEREGYLTREGDGRRAIMITPKSATGNEPTLNFSEENIVGVKSYLETSLSTPSESGTISLQLIPGHSNAGGVANSVNVGLLHVKKGDWGGTA